MHTTEQDSCKNWNFCSHHWSFLELPSSSYCSRAFSTQKHWPKKNKKKNLDKKGKGSCQNIGNTILKIAHIILQTWCKFEELLTPITWLLVLGPSSHSFPSIVSKIWVLGSHPSIKSCSLTNKHSQMPTRIVYIILRAMAPFKLMLYLNIFTNTNIC